MTAPSEEEKPKENWVDIRNLLDDVSKELKLGDLVHGANFHLGDAMCCLEVMHPKMDSGMTKEEKVTLDDLIATGALPNDDLLSLPDVIGLFDQLLSCEMTYYQGQPVPQTLFTCLYLHRPLTLTNLIVRAFVIVTLKTASSVRRVVQKADVFEEEDFVVQLFEFGLCDELLDSEALRLIKEAEELLASKLSAATDEERPLYDAVTARLKFRKQLYLSHIYLDKFSEKNFESAKKTLTAAQAEFEKLKSSTGLGKIPEGVFDTRVTRHVMSSSPPRTTTIISQDKTFAFFEEQLKHMLFVCNYPLIEPSFTSLSDFYLEFSYLIPDIVARSRFHANFMINKKIMDVMEPLPFAVDAMKKMGIPVRYFEKLDEKPSLKKFTDRVATVLCVYFKVIVNNRSRLRRKICHVLDDFVVLQSEADELDDDINTRLSHGDPSRIFGAYIVELKLRLLALWLNLGFELEVYPNEEHYMIYWYLDYLLAVNVSNQSYLLDLNRKEIIDKNPKGKNRKLLQQQQKQTQLFTASFFIPHYLLASNLYLAKGMLRFLSGLRKIGYLNAKEYPYGDPEVRFLKRFSVFHRMQYQPQPLFYHHFTEVSDKDFAATSAENMFTSAVQFFQLAKEYLEKVLHNQQPAPSPAVVVDVKNLLRIAISNTLQSQMLLKTLTPNALTQDTLTPEAPKPKAVTFNFSTHRYYPIVSVAK